MQNKRPLVIIGNGGAAVQAIMALRANQYGGEIHVFSDHAFPAYNPMLTSYFVAGKIKEAACYPFGADLDFYQRHQVTLHMASPVVKLDAEKQTVVTQKGLQLEYDKCLVAAGASSLMPPIPGIQSSRVFGFRTMQDAFALKEALTGKPKRALVVGASMTGIKAAEIFLEMGLEVCMADLMDRIFPSLAYPESSRLLEKLLAAKGLRFRFGAGIEGIEEASASGKSGEGGVKAYFGDGGKAEEADIVVMAIGVRPNLAFIDRSQVEIDKGIVVDETMRSNCPNLYAAGDVAQGTNLLNGRKQIIGLWANACYQGRTAGRNMAGVYAAWPGYIPHNISHFLGLNFVSIGDIGESGEMVTDYQPEKQIYRCFVKKEDRLVGLNLINCFLEAGMLKKYFTQPAAKIPLDPAGLISDLTARYSGISKYAR